jgi:hypothetical protein
MGILHKCSRPPPGLTSPWIVGIFSTQALLEVRALQPGTAFRRTSRGSIRVAGLSSIDHIIVPKQADLGHLTALRTCLNWHYTWHLPNVPFESHLQQRAVQPNHNNLNLLWPTSHSHRSLKLTCMLSCPATATLPRNRSYLRLGQKRKPLIMAAIPRRRLGNTGLEVSVLGFGASPLGGVFQVRIAQMHQQLR